MFGGSSLDQQLWPSFAVIALLATGVALFRAAGRIEADSSPGALLDLATSLFGVCIVGLLLYLVVQRLQPVWFVSCSIVAGVSSSALFRLRMKPPE